MRMVQWGFLNLIVFFYVYGKLSMHVNVIIYNKISKILLVPNQPQAERHLNKELKKKSKMLRIQYGYFLRNAPHSSHWRFNSTD